MKEPTHPAPAPVREIRAHAGERADQPAAAPLPEEHAPAAALLTRLARTEPRLTLGAADTLALAPLAARWLEHGVTELETRSLLTSGLPPRIHSPRALLADRLTRKLPAPRAHSDPYAPAAPLPECTSCGAPLHRGAHARVCARCSTQALSAGSPGRVAGHAEDAPSAGVHVVERAAELRAIVRAARPHHARAA
ncbi:hypothetical protein [Streptomyces smaragdinus]|uniref:hypothetical protein n=1 Tax=Streptomyces smaragdinus TaxID=2585196 RepID=UPI0018869CCC|nr:hypothetical protein [Streptomyces smaragdinus]